MKYLILTLLALMPVGCVSAMRPADQAEIAATEAELEAMKAGGSSPEMIAEKEQELLEAKAEGAGHTGSDWYVLAQLLAAAGVGGSAAHVALQKLSPSRAAAELAKVQGALDALQKGLEPTQHTTS